MSVKCFHCGNPVALPPADFPTGFTHDSRAYHYRCAHILGITRPPTELDLLRTRIAYADDVIVSCVREFLYKIESDNELYLPSYGTDSPEVRLVKYAVDAGMIEPIEGKRGRYRWVKV